MINLKHTTPIHEACRLSGGQASLARSISVSPANVQQWIKGIRPIPAGRCIAIEKATNGQVTRKDLRPDDWHLIWPEFDNQNFESTA